MSILVEIDLEEPLEVVLSDKALEVGQKLEAFLVWNSSECVVWVVSLEDRVYGRVCVVKSKVLHVSPQSRVSKKSLNFGKVSAMQLATNFPLFENSESLVDPEMLPVSAGHIISTPGVCNLMGSNVDLRLIANNDCWRCESEEWVFHASKGERGWKYDDGVVTPNVWSKIRLCGVEEGLKSVELSCNSVNVRWLCDDANPSSKRSVLEVTNNNGDKVGWNGNLAAEP